MSGGFTRQRPPQSPNKENELQQGGHFRNISESQYPERNFRNNSEIQQSPHMMQSREFDDTRNKLLNTDVLQSKPYGPTAIHQTINLGATHTTYIRDNLIWKSFPWTRGFLSLGNLVRCKQKGTFVDYIGTTQPLNRPNELEKLRGQVTRINVIETSQLELDRHVIHPFVKVHIVDMTTGRYIAKREAKCVLSPNEGITIMNSQKMFVESGLDYIPPLATNCCDLRQEGIARAKWNHSIILNEDASWLFDSKTIMLFEILDFNKELIKEGSSKLDNNYCYRIAWGYLRLAGLAKNHIGLSKIQLYKYKFEPSHSTAAYISKNYKRIPFVYYDFLYPNRTNYQGYLSVQVNGIPVPRFERVLKNSKHIFEIEEDDIFHQTNPKQKAINAPYEDHGDPEFVKRQKMLLKRKRFHDDECRIPTDILFRFQSAAQGCFRLTFSPNGKYLAAACTHNNNKTVIKVFNVEDGVLKYTLKGHKNLIHDLNWHPSNCFLVSCSNDNTSKIWRIPEFEMDDIEEEESEKQLLVCTLQHTFYVYSAKFYIDRDTSTLIVVTASYDAKLRVWRIDFENDRYVRNELVREEFLSFGGRGAPQDEPINLMEHRHPNILRFDSEGRLYVGDSLGTIHIWDLSIKFGQITLSKLREINHTELRGDAINTLMVTPSEKKKIMVHSRDNCIRVIDYSHPSGARITARYHGSKSQKVAIRSVVSPDNQYVLSGSEDGKIYLWDFLAGDLYDTNNLGLSILGPVTDVDWNSNYHMIAVSGFGDQYPILVFASELQEGDDIHRVLDKMKSYDETSRRLDDNSHDMMPVDRRLYDRGDEGLRRGDEGARPAINKRRTLETH